MTEIELDLLWRAEQAERRADDAERKLERVRQIIDEYFGAVDEKELIYHIKDFLQ